MKEDYLVSIIIPAYNVEKYITNCVHSILNQNYSNIEILIIDDGSTDKTGTIIDEYSQKDKRIITFHKLNEGVSSARNYGITQAKGEYIVFVDGDDALSEDFVEYMLNLITKNNADFALSKNCFSSISSYNFKDDHIDVLSQELAIALLLSPKIIVGCWNKIYKTALIKEKRLTFSKELFYGEGLEFIIKVAQNSNKIVVGSKKVYFYRRDNSSSATTTVNINGLRNGEKALIQIRNNLKFEDSYLIQKMLNFHYCSYCVGAMMQLKSAKSKNTYLSDYIRWKKFLHFNFIKAFLVKDVSLYRKSVLLIGFFSPGLLSFLINFKKKNKKFF